MAVQVSLSLGLLVLLNFLFFREISTAQAPIHNINVPFNRCSFPPNFIFGTASSAYQYEGAAFEDGKGTSICDTFTHKYPEKAIDRSNGDVADDFYHLYKEDVQLMKYIGLNGFRFSISWSRVLPHGKLSKGVNKLGIAFYNNLINDLISKELCFKEFGDRVKYWSTFNEPWTFSTGGYDSTTFIGSLAPGRCSAWMNKGCPAGDSSTEPYLVAHHIILSHAAAAKLYREKYKPSQKGQIGIVLVTNWMLPYSNAKSDAIAAQRVLDFFLGWFLDPLTSGDYPKSMRDKLGGRLPKFTQQQSKLIRGSLDFLGLNYYSSSYAKDIPHATTVNISYTSDFQVNITSIRNGKPIGAPTGAGFLYVYPKGLTEILVYLKKNYHNPTIYITENGLAETNINSIEQAIHDTNRIKFYSGHFKALKAAIEKGVDVRGFFAWTFLDTYEWGSGYTMKFGITYVDFKNKLKRYPKHSALWLKQFLK
ncbi:beta-glucosidase 12 isoform X2 [Coffea arabica]|uniref:Beta-glucosidase 12 isoform X2 n=1 Tax=Coffea arabica TaxID=13443 RepID=A0A6P6WEB4_COFAR|nr:beta-glucosidase 12-like isoform X2 [Coffea arabica]